MCKYERLVRFSDAKSDTITYYWQNWNELEVEYIEVMEFILLVEFRFLVKHSINTFVDGSTKSSYTPAKNKSN